MRSTLAIAIGSALCFSALGEEQSLQQKNQQSVFRPGSVSEQRLNQTVTDINKASTFMGMPVKNLQNQDLGKVQDLVFDPKEGKIAYVVISTGGFLGVADKAVAVPLNSLQPKEGAKHLVLNMSKEQLSSAPGLAQNNWPNLDTFASGAAAGSETGSQQEKLEPSEKPQEDSSSAEPAGDQPSITEAEEKSEKLNNDALIIEAPEIRKSETLPPEPEEK